MENLLNTCPCCFYVEIQMETDDRFEKDLPKTKVFKVAERCWIAVIL